MDMEIPREADLMDHPILFRESLILALVSECARSYLLTSRSFQLNVEQLRSISRDRYLGCYDYQLNYTVVWHDIEY